MTIFKLKKHHTNTLFQLFSILILSLLLSQTGQAEEIHYRIQKQVLHPIDARMFGSFMERPSWGGETGPEGALVPGTHQLQPGVVKLLREMQIPIVRFPGGTDADFLDWRDMVSNVPGRDAARPVSTGHKNDKVTNNFGYDEFLQLRQELGWEPVIVVNFRNGLLKVKPIEEAARQTAGLVAYCNAPVGAKLPPGMPDWPSIRAQNGHPEPYNVKRWQIGNETWAFHKKASKLAPDNTDAYYADCVLAYVRAMLAVDPTLEFIVDGGKGGELARQQMPQKIRHLVFHSYMPWAIKEAFRNGQPVQIETLSAAEIWRAWVATPGFNNQGLSEFHDKLIPQARKNGFKVAVTEWNWNGWWQDGNAALNSLFAVGVGAAGFVHALMRAGDVIEIGCQSMLVGHAWEGIHAIKVDPAGRFEPYYIPSGQVMALYAAHHGSQLLALEATGIPTYEQQLKLGGINPSPKVAYLDALVTADDKTVYFHVINRHFDQAMTMTLDTGACGPLADQSKLFVLEGRLQNQSAPAEPPQISHITESAVPCGPLVTLCVPARSVSCLEMPRRLTRGGGVSNVVASSTGVNGKTYGKPNKIICTEQKSGRLLLMDADADWNDPKAILWQWSPSQSKEIKPEHRAWFNLLTDGKFVMNGTHVITSASGGGIALIRMEDKKVLFHALADGNTHSVEILPDGNLVSASSSGNFLKVFFVNPAVSQSPETTRSSSLTLTDAHGVVWDGKLKRLWAVGRDELVRCTYNGNKAEPKLEIEAHFKLPGYGGGHDLFSVPGSRKLFVTGEKVWVFNTETEMFSDFDQSNSIKSVSQRAANGPVIFMQATQSWWSDSIIFSGNSSKKTLKDAQFYKARWWVPNAFSTVE